ncbi:MAG: glycerol-3-phosphate dehydrogenase, partial [Pseudomonadota bacterium]|nr:glycerol-3-phosphate dehydrogenase [Pseudomonadota bacterium]
ETTPRLTISSHRLPDGAHVWYLGGSLAEKGAGMAPEELIELAKQELAELIPWVNLDGADWATLPVERAEPLQPGMMRPDNAFIAPATGAANLLVGWPTKLTLAPNLANQALGLLADAGIAPSANTINLRHYLPYAELAKTPWELAFPPAISAEEALARRLNITGEEGESDEDNN